MTEPLTTRNICGFPRGYGTVCNQTATHGDQCAEHHDIRCRSCGDPATTACDYCGQFVCGAPLCPLCEGHETAGAPGAWGFMNHSHRRKAVVQQIAPKPAEPEAEPLTAREEMARRLARHMAGGRDIWELYSPDLQHGWLAMADEAMAGTVRRIRAEAAEYAARGRSDVRAVLEQIAEELER